MLSTKDGKKKRIPLEQKTTQQLVKVADQYFSKYVRLRDCTQSGSTWVGKCITCNKQGVVARLEDGKIKWSVGWDAGHFITRGNKCLRFDEENVNLQCAMACNRYKSGNIEKYKPALDMKYGDGTWRKLQDTAQGNQYYKFSKAELLQIISDCKTQVSFYVGCVE